MRSELQWKLLVSHVVLFINYVGQPFAVSSTYSAMAMCRNLRGVREVIYKLNKAAPQHAMHTMLHVTPNLVSPWSFRPAVGFPRHCLVGAWYHRCIVDTQACKSCIDVRQTEE